MVLILLQFWTSLNFCEQFSVKKKKKGREKEEREGGKKEKKVG